MTFRVLATARSFCNTPGAHHDLLRDGGCELDLRASVHPLSSDKLAAVIPGYDGAVLGLDVCDASVITAADRLRAIARYGAGVDSVDLKAAAERDIIVTNTPGANQIAVTELAIGLMFSLLRSIPQVASAAKTGQWLRPTGGELNGRTLGVVGFGAIGRGVATRAAALGMRVIAYDPFWQGDNPIAAHATLDEVFTQADVVTLHSALTLETRGLVNTYRLSTMKPTAYIINTARGELVDENALYDALASRRLAGAAADVFHHEPPQDSPLLTLDNFIATPHIGATTTESVARMAMMASQNLLATLRGEPCPNIVRYTGV